MTIQKIPNRVTLDRAATTEPLTFNEQLLVSIDNYLATDSVPPRVHAQQALRAASVSPVIMNDIELPLETNERITALLNCKQALLDQLAANATLDNSSLPQANEQDEECAANHQKINTLKAKIAALKNSSPFAESTTSDTQNNVIELKTKLSTANNNLAASRNKQIARLNQAQKNLEVADLKNSVQQEQLATKRASLLIKINVLTQAEKFRDQEINTYKSNIAFYEKKNNQFRTEINQLISDINRINEGCQSLVEEATRIENVIQAGIDANLNARANAFQQFEQAEQNAYDTQLREHQQANDRALQLTQSVLDSTRSQYSAIAQNHATQMHQAQQTHLQNLNAIIDNNLAQVKNSTYRISTHNNYLYSPEWEQLRFDINSKHAMLWKGGPVKNGRWKLIPCPENGFNVFKFQCVHDQYYLHSSGHDALHHNPNNYRDVTTFNARNIASTKEILWKLWPGGEDNQYWIQSLYCNQYLNFEVHHNKDKDRFYAMSINTPKITWHIKRIC